MDGSLTLKRNNIRMVSFGLWFALLGALFFLDQAWWLALRNCGIYTGWLLFATMIALTLFNLRKKLPFLPLGRMATWTRFHVFMGWTSGIIFLLHTGFRLPDGGIGILLYVVYLSVFFTGFLGLLISRRLSKTLNWRGKSAIYERIPQLIAEHRAQAESIVIQSLKETDSNTLADFYRDHLAHFFSGTRNFGGNLFESKRFFQKTKEQMNALKQYLNERECQLLRELEVLVESKDNLDYQFVAQSILKYWLFIHIPLSYSLLIFGLLHGLIVTAFVGGH